MKKEEIEWEDVPLNDNEIRIAQYQLDESKLQILENKNKLELMRYKIDNNVSKSMSRNLIRLMKRDLKKFETDLKKLASKECELTEEQKSDEKLIIEFTIKECVQKIEETELNIKHNLNARLANQTMGDIEDKLKVIENNMKVYQNMVRNKVRKVVKPRVQLSDKEGDNNGAE